MVLGLHTPVMAGIDYVSRGAAGPYAVTSMVELGLGRIVAL